MTYISIKILRFIYVYVYLFTHVYNGLSWLLTNILVPQFGHQTKNLSSALAR